MNEAIDTHDERRRRCPMLGHEAPFSYCRCPASDVPCRKIFDCWWETFDVQSFLQTHLSAEAIAEIHRPRPDKIVSLVQLIRQAQQRSE